MPNVPGHRWKRRRAGLRITQEAAAEEFGLSKRTIQNIETNPKHKVSMDVVYAAEAVYGVSAAWLLGDGADDKPEEKPKGEPRREPSGDPLGPPPRPDRDRKGPPRTDRLRAAS